MTWTKLSDDFGDDCARVKLSDAAFRTHVEGLLWTMRRETGGFLAFRDVRRFAESVDVDAAVTELVAAEFWTLADGGYQVVRHMADQPEPDLIAKRRELAAERQRRKRRKRAGLDMSPRDNPRDYPRYPGRDGSGREKN